MILVTFIHKVRDEVPNHGNDNVISKDQQTFLAAEIPLIARFMEQCKVPRSQWLLGTGWKSEDIDKGVDLLTFDKLDIIFRNIFRLSIREDIGIQLGLSLNISRWGVFGLAMLCANKLSEALLTAQRNLPIVHTRFELKGEIIDQSARMSFVRETLFPFPASQEFTYEFVFAALTRQISDILGEPFKFDKIQLPYDRPGYHSIYSEHLAHKVEFNSSTGGAWFSKDLLDRTPKFSNPIAYQQAIEMCDNEMARIDSQRKGSINLLVKHQLARAPYDIPTLDELAGLLVLSPRTLRRRLKDAGTSYRQIMQDHQQDIALRELAEKRYSLAQIAGNCGFRDTKGFREAFKRWTNMSPSEYQKQFP